MSITYDWNEETLEHFRDVMSYSSKQQLIDKVLRFVRVDCSLEDNETEMDLVNDLINQISL
jgi:hypothetical protein